MLSFERPAWMPKTWKFKKSGTVAALRAAWLYQDKTGEPLGWVARYESKTDKETIPFFKLNGTPGTFKAGAAEAPRPLYGMHTLSRQGPVFVVEGEKCAAALHALGLAAVSAPGGAQAADKAEWATLLTGTEVIIWPDHDQPGRDYACAAWQAIQSAGKAVRVIAEPPEGQPDTAGSDCVDWLQSALTAQGLPWDGIGPLPEGSDLAALQARLLATVETVAGPMPAAWLPAPKPERKPKDKTPGKVRYVITDAGTKVLIAKPDGIEERQLTNFGALIVGEVLHDDGLEARLLLAIEGTKGGRPLPAVEILAEQFSGMQWVAKHWGSGCIIWPGQTVKDTLRFAIQTLSTEAGEIARRTVYAHGGWREIAGRWHYLSAGGALHAGGRADGVEVDLGELNRYALPETSPDPEGRLAAARASMQVASCAPARVSVPLTGAAFLAPLAQSLGVDFALWLEGPSRSRKSSLAAAHAAHFGPAIERTSLTANWTDTPNAIEHKLFTLADGLAVIDDYAPQPSPGEQAKLDATVSRVVRAIGNRAGRSRMRADLSMRPDRYPRAMVIATAEQWPQGESINARLFGVSLRPGEVDLARLSQSQADARAGLLARCMADYIQGMAAGYAERIEAARARWHALRNDAMREGLQGRLPEQVAFLQVGYEAALSHWRDAGALSKDTAAELQGMAWATLLDLARRHDDQVRSAQPAETFRFALVDLLSGAAVHLLDKVDGKGPPNAERYGWRNQEPQGPHIGWVSEQDGCLYLLPTPTMQAVNEALRRSDNALNIRPAALWRQLKDRGYLLAGDMEKREVGMVDRSTRKTYIQGKSISVLVFSMAALGFDGATLQA